MDSDGDSSPWDSPLSSRRLPVTVNEQSHNLNYSWDSDAEESIVPKAVRDKDAPTPKLNGPKADLTPSTTEKKSHSNTKKSAKNMNQSQDGAEFHDLNKSAKLPRIRDKAAPRKRTKGSTYAANLTDQETASQDQRTDESQTTCLQVCDSVPPDITQLPTAAGNRHSSELHNMEQNLSGESEQKKNSSHCLVNMTCLKDTEQQETYALPKYLYHDQNKEPLYMDPVQILEKNPQVILMKEVPPYKDEQYMYAFHYGNVQFYRARMTENQTYTGKLADRVDRMSLRIWGEVFGALRILISPFMFFVNELSAFLFTYIFQVLVVGLLSTFGDHVLKPLMVALFNNILQPIFTFLLNIMSSLQALLVPLWNLFNGFAQVLATVVRSFRLVEIHTGPMIYSKPVKEV